MDLAPKTKFKGSALEWGWRLIINRVKIVLNNIYLKKISRCKRLDSDNRRIYWTYKYYKISKIDKRKI